MKNTLFSQNAPAVDYLSLREKLTDLQNITMWIRGSFQELDGLLFPGSF